MIATFDCAKLSAAFSDKNQPVRTSGTNPTSKSVMITKYIKLIFFDFGGIGVVDREEFRYLDFRTIQSCGQQPLTHNKMVVKMCKLLSMFTKTAAPNDNITLVIVKRK